MHIMMKYATTSLFIFYFGILFSAPPPDNRINHKTEIIEQKEAERSGPTEQSLFRLQNGLSYSNYENYYSFLRNIFNFHTIKKLIKKPKKMQEIPMDYHQRMRFDIRSQLLARDAAMNNIIQPLHPILERQEKERLNNMELFPEELDDELEREIETEFFKVSNNPIRVQPNHTKKILKLCLSGVIASSCVGGYCYTNPDVLKKVVEIVPEVMTETEKLLAQYPDTNNVLELILKVALMAGNHFERFCLPIKHVTDPVILENIAHLYVETAGKVPAEKLLEIVLLKMG